MKNKLPAAFLFGSLLMLGMNGFAQQGSRDTSLAKVQEERLIQLTGMVRNELLEPQQFVHIILKNKRRGTISDYNGMFSFVVSPLDTVLFSAVGLKTFRLTIPANPARDYYHVEIRMQTDTILIDEVVILPWKTYEEFRDAFINLELPDDDLQRAYKNFSNIMAQIDMDGAPDPSLNYKYLMNEYYNQLYSQGQLPYYSIFDPMRWKKFIEYLEQGKFRNPDRKKKD
jgi:hypothetical protein